MGRVREKPSPQRLRKRLMISGAHRMIPNLMLPVIALSFLPLVAYSQAGAPAGWNDPFPPHRIMDNFYYVGTRELASFLIATPQGLILMNSDYESSVPVIRKNVE